MKLILDPGSTHMGCKDYGFELIERAKEAGADAVKFQLFKPDSPAGKVNVALPYEWMFAFTELGSKLGIEVFASCWDFDGINTLLMAGCGSIKFSYSQAGNEGLVGYARERFQRIYLSYDVMNRPTRTKTSQEKWLYCIPEYPVRYEAAFYGLFPMFDGWSDHSMGIWQTVRAVLAGAGIIEKHVRLDHAGINCPDARFAIGFEQVKELVNIGKGLSCAS